LRALVFSAGTIAIALTVLHLIPGSQARLEAETMLVLGFVLLISYLFGKKISRWKLPKISGYLIAGIILGPHMADIFTVRAVRNLELIEHIALSFIALTAGGEFRISKLKKNLSLFSNVILWQIIIVMMGMTGLVLVFRPFISFLSESRFPVVLGVGMIFGVLSVAKSPATTIAIINETHAKGRFTDFVLGITVLKDVLIVLLFALILSLSQPLFFPEQEFHADYVLNVLKEILLSLGGGVLAGFLIHLYIKYVKQQPFLFLLGFILLVYEISVSLHLELILVFMVAGFFVANFTENGEGLITAIEKGSLPIYVLFFTLAGASLHVNVFLSAWSFTLIIVLFRMAATYAGTFVGGKISGTTREIKHFGWMGFVGQAGLTLGLSTIVAQTLPAPLGGQIRTIIIAAIAINQILGPILFRYSLGKSGEMEQKPAKLVGAM